MVKPNNYDETQAGGEYTPIELGGHTAVIKSLKEQKSSTGKDMVVVAIDFDKKDIQPGYFSEQFEKDIRPDKKWPYLAVQYIVSVDKDDNCSRSFKSFMTAFEDSNNTKIDWDAKDFSKQFKNKKIGVVYGAVEEEYNGEVKTRHRIRWFCDYAKAKDAEIPALREYNPPFNVAQAVPQKPAPANDGFMLSGEEEEIPF